MTRIDPEDRAILLGAIATLGEALTVYDHHWSEGERAIYEEAYKILGSDPGESRGKKAKIKK